MMGTAERKCPLCYRVLVSEGEFLTHLEKSHGHTKDTWFRNGVPEEPDAGLSSDKDAVAEPGTTEGSPAMGCLVLLIIVAVLALIGSMMGGGDGVDSAAPATTVDEEATDEEIEALEEEIDDSLRHGAYEACKELVNDQLKAPRSASYPDYYDYDGEVTVLRSEQTFSVASHVDAENSFGAEVRTRWTCSVTHTFPQQWQGSAVLLEP